MSCKRAASCKSLILVAGLILCVLGSNGARISAVDASRRQLQQQPGGDNVTIVRSNTSAVGTHFDVEWEVGWPGLYPTCNGFLLWTVTNYNDIPLDRGAPGPYAMVLPNGMSYIPYYSWGFMTSLAVFPPGIVLPMYYLGFYMGPLFNSTFGTGFSCNGRCPCERIPSTPVYVGPGGTMPPLDNGPSIDKPAILPSDLTFTVARTYPANAAGFDGSWIDRQDMCTGQLIYDIHNLNDAVIDPSVSTQWTVCLPTDMSWADPTSWGFNTSAMIDDSGCVGIENVGFYMTPFGTSGAVAQAAFGLTIKCADYVNNTGNNIQPCSCPGIASVSVMPGMVAAALPAPGISTFPDLADYQLYPSLDLTTSKTLSSAVGSISFNAEVSPIASPSNLFFDGFGGPAYRTASGISSIAFIPPPGTTAFGLYFTASSWPVPGDAYGWTATATMSGPSGTAQISVTGGPGDTSAPYGFPLSFGATSPNTISAIKIVWADGGAGAGFTFGNIELSSTSVF